MRGLKHQDAERLRGIVADIVADAVAEERARCAWIAEAMIIGGRAWTKEQADAAEALHMCAANIRNPKVTPPWEEP